MSPVHSMPLHLRFGDEDSYGHVNNVRYFQFLEDARVHLMSGATGGAALLDTLDPDHYTLVGRQEIEYLAPLNFSTVPAAVDVWTTAVGTSSFDLGYAVRDRATDSVTSAIASTTMVLVSRSTGRPVRLSGIQQDLLRSWQGPPVPFRRARAR